jgi:hypothetical protein
MRKPVARPVRPAPEASPRRFTLAEKIAIMRVAVEGGRQARLATEAAEAEFDAAEVPKRKKSTLCAHSASYLPSRRKKTRARRGSR